MKNQLNAPSPEMDEADQPDLNASSANLMTSLDLAGKNVRSIIWTTGFSGDYSYIKLPVFDEQGNLKINDGVPLFPVCISLVTRGSRRVDHR